MKVSYARNVDLQGLLDPGARCWEATRTVELDLAETPLALQPTDAIRAQRSGLTHGAIRKASLAALHNGTVLGFRLQWPDPSEDREILDNDQFVDAAAIMLPVVPDAPLLLMGEKGRAVNAWYWRADDGKTGRNVTAEGFGSSRTVDRNSVVCSQQWQGGLWTVVITRHLRLDTAEPVAQLAPGGQSPFGVAIWDGQHQERAGLKAFALSREDLTFEPIG